MIGELFAVWCDLWTIINVSRSKAPLCGQTETVIFSPWFASKESGCYFDVRKSASNVLLCMKDLQMCAYCPDCRHVAYFIIHCQWLQIKCLFSGKKRTVVPDPLHLAYAVYAFINVDNCERPLIQVEFWCLLTTNWVGFFQDLLLFSLN